MKIGVPSMVEEVVASEFASRDVAKAARSLQRHDRKSKRELANRNERKRMKVINDGFQSLRKLLPFADDEKLSKAAILQRTVEYISQLLQERQKILKHLDELNSVKILKMSETKDEDSERSTFGKLQVANGACLPARSCFVSSYNGVMSSVPGGQELEVQNMCINNSQQNVRISLPLGVSNQIQSQVLPIHLEAMETEHHREEVVSSSPSSDFTDGGSCNIGNLDVILRAIHSIEGMDSNDESNDESEQDSESDYALALVH